MLSTSRIQRLAKVYGPWLRFFPEGSEDNDEPIDKAIKTAEKAEKTPEEQAAIDKARKAEQDLEQERATAKRANEAAREAQSGLDAAKQETAALKEQLAEAEAKAAEAGIKDVELKEEDYEGTDLAIVRAVKSLKENLAAKDTEIKGLKQKAKEYEAQVAKKEAVKATNDAYQGLLNDLDSDYGEDCRNEAVAKFNELVAAGKVPKGNPAKATRIMERCYKEAKTAKEKKKSDLPLDSGSGGGNPPSLSGVEIKDGQSLDEAVKQIAAASKG